MITKVDVTLIAAILAFTSSIIGLIVSGYNARFRRYALEKWWEKKYEAYSNIVDSLSDMVEYYRRILSAEEGGESLSSKILEPLQENWFKAIHRVNKATSMGAFLISAEAEEILRKFRKDFENVNYGNMFEDYSQQWDVAENCLYKLTIIARKDLVIKNKMATSGND